MTNSEYHARIQFDIELHQLKYTKLPLKTMRISRSYLESHYLKDVNLR